MERNTLTVTSKNRRASSAAAPSPPCAELAGGSGRAAQPQEHTGGAGEALSLRDLVHSPSPVQELDPLLLLIPTPPRHDQVLVDVGRAPERGERPDASPARRDKRSSHITTEQRGTGRADGPDCPQRGALPPLP